jgi:hypothetical protein
MNDCERYCPGLDNSTYITDHCQFVIFVGTIEDNFEIKEEFLKLQHLTTGTEGSDVFEAINKVVSELASFDRCTVIVND